MKKIITAIVIIAVGIQFIPVSRTNPEVEHDFDGPQAVKVILTRSCYDCHSNETDWPWYSYVAPVSWMVAHHVEEGRKHLNFSNWAPLKQMSWMRREIHEEVEAGKMPLRSYLILHSAAKVSDEELAMLQDWADN